MRSMVDEHLAFSEKTALWLTNWTERQGKSLQHAARGSGREKLADAMHNLQDGEAHAPRHPLLFSIQSTGQVFSFIGVQLFILSATASIFDSMLREEPSKSLVALDVTDTTVRALLALLGYYMLDSWHRFPGAGLPLPIRLEEFEFTYVPRIVDPDRGGEQVLRPTMRSWEISDGSKDRSLRR